MNQTWRTHLQSKLQQLHEREQYRNLHVTEQAEETWLIRDEKRMLNLASNNYLGLAGDERLKKLLSHVQENMELGRQHQGSW